MPARGFGKNLQWGLAWAGGVTLATALIGWVIYRNLATDVLPTACHSYDLPCYINQMNAGISTVRQEVAFWTWFNSLGQILIVVFGLIATISIALLTDKNKNFTKTIGILGSSLAAGLTSALITLQVPEKVDSLVDHLAKMTRAANDFSLHHRLKAGGRDKDQLQKELASNPKFHDEFITLVNQKMSVYNELKTELLKLGGTASRLRAPKKE
jgi:hypothetical protein